MAPPIEAFRFGNSADAVLGNSAANIADLGGGNDAAYGDTDNDILDLGPGSQEIRWTAGHTGWDTIHGFNIAQDDLVFSRSFFAGGYGSIDLEDYLQVWVSGNNAMLAANTAASGWEFIATFTNVSAIALGQAIEAGTVVSLMGTAEAAGTGVAPMATDFGG